jgi:uncharacterized protein (DUF1778 family)
MLVHAASAAQKAADFILRSSMQVAEAAIEEGVIASTTSTQIEPLATL